MAVCGQVKVTRLVRVGFEEDEAGGLWELRMKGKGKAEVKRGNEMRLPWLWVEGWRARLTAGGDVVERCTHAT